MDRLGTETRATLDDGRDRDPERLQAEGRWLYDEAQQLQVEGRRLYDEAQQLQADRARGVVDPVASQQFASAMRRHRGHLHRFHLSRVTR